MSDSRATGALANSSADLLTAPVGDTWSVPRSPAALDGKRVLDLAGALAALVLFLPLAAVVAALVARDGGPVVFAHERIGRNGRRFRCLKFRTMVTNSKEVLDHLLATDPQARAEWERDFKLRNDPRITPVGRFLRKTSLDELPQIINVLRGDMSLVGPRPIVAAEVPRYGEHIAWYYACRPGVTGLWQVSGRNDTSYAHRVELDTRYARSRTLWGDLSIILRTVGVIFRGSGAY